MNFQFDSSELYKAFNLVCGVVPSTTTKHILQGVMLEVKGNNLELTTTDLEIYVKYTIPLQGMVEDAVGAGAAGTDKPSGHAGIVLPATRTNNILREWSNEGMIAVSIEGGHCILKTRLGRFKIVGEEQERFPKISAIEMSNYVEIDSQIIGEMVGKVIHTVAKESVNTILSGVYVKILGDDIIMVATDRHSLSWVKRKVENTGLPGRQTGLQTGGAGMQGIVTVKSLNFLQRFVSECKGKMKVGIGESQLHFIGTRGEIISQLIEGKYPNYEDVIPRHNEIRVEVNKNELLSVVKAASFITQEDFRAINFAFRDGRMILVSRAADIGEAELEVAINYQGPELETCFNPDYILNAIKTCDEDTISMELKDRNSPALFRTGYEQFTVIMPLDLEEID